MRRGDCFFDVIFGSATAVVSISDHWFQESHPAEIYDVPVQLTPPTEMIWSKALLQNRHRYDGADIAHLILRQCERIDWQRLLTHMEQYWEVLLIHLLNFRFIYPVRAGAGAALAVRRVAPAGAPAGRPADAADQGLPRPAVLRRGLSHRRAAWGFADVVGPATAETDG